jgi:hypothetical protein
MYEPITKDNLDAVVDAAMERARLEPDGPYIAFAKYHAGPGMEFLEMRLTDGRRLLVPRGELGELKNATPEQAADVVVLAPGDAVYWKQLDDGLHLADFLEYRWRREPEAAAA